MNDSGQPRSGHVVIGVDTHKHVVHVAAVMDTVSGISLHFRPRRHLLIARDCRSK